MSTPIETTVALRVDVSSHIGIGHFMRCLTLADALRVRGAYTRFVCRHLPAHIRDVLRDRGHDVAPLDSPPSEAASDDSAHVHWLGTGQAADARDTLKALADRAWRWIVVDHYGLDVRWETAVRDVTQGLFVIDDLADRAHDCDVLLDQNYYADIDTRYAGKVPRRCELLLGPRYALLREEFLGERSRMSPRNGPAARLLVCFGGVDADNHTGRTLDALADDWARDLIVDVVIGMEHSHRAGIEATCAARGFAVHVQSNRMARFMAAADLSIGAGGSTTWERCCLGLPTLVFGLAANQRQLIRDSAAAGLIYAPDQAGDTVSPAFIGRHLQALLENTGLRQALSRRGMELVDGRGACRVAQRLGAVDIEIRPARPEDSRMLFDWRNHPTVRSASHQSDPIEWPTHEKWFTFVLASPDRLLLIGHRGGAPVGVVRFDIQGPEAEVSIYLVPGSHDPGAGGQLLHQAERSLASARPDVLQIRAEVRGHNLVSNRLFAGAGYRVGYTSYIKPLATT